MHEILADYTFVTGRMAVPLTKASGSINAGFHDYTEEEILDIGRGYRERQIPCDVLWLDIGYMDRFRVFSWDTSKFPDVPALIGKMRAEKFRLVTIVDLG